MTDKPKRKTPFSKGGSHYKPPSGIPAGGKGWGGAASGKAAKAFDAEHQPPGEVKAAGMQAAAEIKARLAEKREALVAKLLHLAEHAENEAVQLQATNAALDRLMGKPAASVDVTSKGERTGYVVAAPFEAETAEEWTAQHKPH